MVNNQQAELLANEGIALSLCGYVRKVPMPSPKPIVNLDLFYTQFQQYQLSTFQGPNTLKQQI